MARSGEEEVIVALRGGSIEAVVPVTQVRSTLIASSLLAIRERGHLDGYLEKLPVELHATVLESVAGVWLPVGVAMAHYHAADGLGLPVRDQFEIGRTVAERVQQSVLGTLTRLAKGAGVTPWIGLAQHQRLCDRMLQGGASAVYRLGPKEARIEIYGVPIVRFPYFRNGWRGLIAGSGELFATKIYVTELVQLTTASSMVLRVAWA